MTRQVPWSGWSLAAALFLPLVPSLARAHHHEGLNGTSCCYGNTSVEHGETALSLPSCCIRLLCCNGTLLTTYVDFDDMLARSHHLDPCYRHHDHHHHHHGNDTNHTTYPPDHHHHHHHHHGHPHRSCCEWQGAVYPNDYVLDLYCWHLVCHDGHWDFNGYIDPSCGHCWLHDDPHITTFQGSHFDWHGVCNYSLAQTNFSQEPHTGLFATFKKCFNRPSCLQDATFRENPHSVISLSAAEPFKLNINGEEFHLLPYHSPQHLHTSGGAHPALGFRYHDCGVILGVSGFVVMQCSHRLDVWVFPELVGEVNGLCGHYGGNGSGVLLGRDMMEYPREYFPTTFPVTWLTDTQPKEDCPERDTIPRVTVKCRVRGKNKKLNKNLCDQNVRGNAYLSRTCQYDLCMLTKATPRKNRKKARKAWLKVVYKNAYMTEWIYNATQGMSSPEIPHH